MDRRKRIAYYGGTFDPIHRGHLEVAHKISRLFEIDGLWFVPAQLAPHKHARDVSPALHRYAMLALATQDEPRFLISTFELEAPGRCYTVDTLAHFKARWADTAELFFIMGADSWSEISTWRDYERLLTLTNHIVVSRPGYSLSAEHVPEEIRKRLVDLRGLAAPEAAKTIENANGERIFMTDAVMTDVSATDIRRAARENSSQLSDLVPAVVAAYIGKYQLYRDTNERQFNN
jgi:nicotinate-nucleotide adenylyltransferase